MILRFNCCMDKVFYLGYFDVPGHRRVVPLAGVTMMDYVSGAIRSAGFECEILSPAQAAENMPLEEVVLDDGRKVIFLPSHKSGSRKNLARRACLRIRRKLELYRELDRRVKEGDTLLVYHSLAYIDVLRRLRKKKRFRLVLQVCEIYADVLEDRKKREQELEWIGAADAYIFSTNQLERLLNGKGKPSLICLGTYREEKRLVAEGENDDRVHVVYAGTFDPRKGGGQAAAAAAAFLSLDYHVHIIGFGSDSETSQMKELVNGLSKSSSCLVSYDGCLSGREYLEFIQRCDIGLSTQNPAAAFNATSFPSKILSYMSNGLHVVSIRIPAIEDSAVGDLITYYDDQTPEKIAEAIQKVNLKNKGQEQARIKKLDADFQKGVKKLFRSAIGR